MSNYALNDNPAERLRRLIHAMLQSSEEWSGNAWLGILGLPQETPPSLTLKRIAPLLTVPDDAKEAIKLQAPPERLERYLTWVPAVERAFSIGLRFDQSWREVKGHLAQPEIRDLDFAVHLLDDSKPPRLIDSNEVDGLTRDATELMDAVASAQTLDPTLRTFLLQHLGEILSALRAAQYCGGAAVEQASADLLGRLYLRPALANRLEQQSRTLYDALGKLILRVALALSIANDGTDLLKKGVDLLQLPPAVVSPATPQPPSDFEPPSEVPRSGPLHA